MIVSPDVDEAMTSVDNAIFESDMFRSMDNIRVLKSILKRWTDEVDTIENTLIELLQDGEQL